MKGTALPSGAGRVLALVERSAPDPNRPRLAKDWEQQLAEVDAKSAACYASMEDLSDQLDRIAQELDGVVIEEVAEGDSLAVRLSEARQGAARPSITAMLAAGAAGNGSLKR